MTNLLILVSFQPSGAFSVVSGQGVGNFANFRSAPVGSGSQALSFGSQSTGEVAGDDQAREAQLLAQQEEEVRRQTLQAIADGQRAADDGNENL